MQKYYAAPGTSLDSAPEDEVAVADHYYSVADADAEIAALKAVLESLKVQHAASEEDRRSLTTQVENLFSAVQERDELREKLAMATGIPHPSM
ncbi:hypothetical protein D3C76_756090 [compost metagenome]